MNPAIHADGIYFGLDKQSYLDDPALGSTDHKMLAFSPVDYWYTRLNPHRRERNTSAQEVGTALHVAVLEGEEMFLRRYDRGPDQDGMSTTEKMSSTKKAKAAAKIDGKISIKADEYDRLLMASAMIKMNPALATAFDGGAAEVSVFWTTKILPISIRKKARFDYLKPRGIGDLKKVANEYEMPFDAACLRAIRFYKYHVQARHYLDARAIMPRLIKNGDYRVNSDTEEELLCDVALEKEYGFQFVFWQGERSPLCDTLIVSHGNPMENARAIIDRAEQNYIKYMAEFGPDRMWFDNSIRPRELHDEDLRYIEND